MSNEKNRDSIKALTVARNIKAVRVGFGLTQTQFGEKISADQAMVSDWELNKHSPSKAALEMIYRAFDIPKGMLERPVKTFEHWLRTCPDPETAQKSIVAEASALYANLEDIDKRMVEEMVEFLRGGNEEARRDLREAFNLVKRANKAPSKRSAG